MRQQLCDRNRFLSSDCKLRPEPADRIVVGGLSPIDDHGEADCSHAFRRRPDIRDGLAFPRPGPCRIRMASPEIDDDLPARDNRKSCTDFTLAGKIRSKGLSDSGVFLVAMPMHFDSAGHFRTPLPATPRTYAVRRRPGIHNRAPAG